MEYGANPWRTPAALAQSREVRIRGLIKAARGQRIMDTLDVKILMWAGPHLLSPILLFLLNTDFTHFISQSFSPSPPLPQLLKFLTYVSLMICCTWLYISLYCSDPAWIRPGIPAPGTWKMAACSMCGEHPSLRSHHCKHTGQCVHKFDHFCWFLSTPIGDRNHRRFWCFLLTEVLLAFWFAQIVMSKVGGCFIQTILARPGAPACQGISTIATLILIFLSFNAISCALFFLQLFVLHTYLILTNQTTLELLKGGSLSYMRPFYMVHDGPFAYRVTFVGFLRMLAHHLRGTGPPLPFSQGVWGNIRVFFWAQKPYDYKYVTLPKSQPDASAGSGMSRVGERVVWDSRPQGGSDEEMGSLLPQGPTSVSGEEPRLRSIAAASAPQAGDVDRV